MFAVSFLRQFFYFIVFHYFLSLPLLVFHTLDHHIKEKLKYQVAIVATKNFFVSPFPFFSSFFDSGGFISGFLIVIQHHTYHDGKKSTLSMLLENSQQLDDNENVLYSMSDEDEDYQHHFHQDSDEDELPKSFNSAHFSVSEDRFMKDHDLKVKAFEALHNSGSNNNNHNQVQTFSPVSPKLTSVKRRSSIIDMPQRLNNFNPAIPKISLVRILLQTPMPCRTNTLRMS